MQRLVSCGIYSVPSATDAIPDKSALRSLPKGSAVIIFTPDSTHFPIAAEALNLGHHVLVTKPATQKLEDHQKLIEIAEEKGLVLMVEHHKRFESVYVFL
jgi:D-galacturonate reductase